MFVLYLRCWVSRCGFMTAQKKYVLRSRDESCSTSKLLRSRKSALVTWLVAWNRFFVFIYWESSSQLTDSYFSELTPPNGGPNLPKRGSHGDGPAKSGGLGRSVACRLGGRNPRLNRGFSTSDLGVKLEHWGGGLGWFKFQQKYESMHFEIGD